MAFFLIVGSIRKPSLNFDTGDRTQMLSQLFTRGCGRLTRVNSRWKEKEEEKEERGVEKDGRGRRDKGEVCALAQLQISR